MVHTTKNGRGPKNGNAAQPPLCIAGNTKFKCGSKLVLSEQKGHATYYKPRNRIDKNWPRAWERLHIAPLPYWQEENQFEERKKAQTMGEYSDSESPRRAATEHQLSKDLSPPELL